MALQLHSITLFLLLVANFYHCKPIEEINEEDTTDFSIKIFRGQKSKEQQVSEPKTVWKISQLYVKLIFSSLFSDQFFTSV